MEYGGDRHKQRSGLQAPRQRHLPMDTSQINANTVTCSCSPPTTQHDTVKTLAHALCPSYQQ
ncbi:uncharacterized protein LACBIDRAFT_309747 [Laccaria bicolor S238N-H82]|uniref:Predicted protein n=1 Tax=Laccaria bicolor (strain S238N-H82 / ATCC MYA-4686) TaxID=486041 RepID=B0DSZ8_LACBS|nr:uncharacterized protein LACBIDRAFT_309747 [Laccaria bicolor S238N-H82]EDR02407.1 predicted protein [Laccaria bicolor S238N-H82]|eukprot:XP_001887084.1 predicted protein [Laccaria bicolor S238N-H82]